jgi:hypothetical protein
MGNEVSRTCGRGKVVCLAGKRCNMEENSINQVFNVVCFSGDCQEVTKQVLELVCEGEGYSKMNTRDEASIFPFPVFPAPLANIVRGTP